MDNEILELLHGKQILILGFGKEGISTYKYLIDKIPADNIAIADQDSDLPVKINFQVDPQCRLIIGKNYLENISVYDIIIKSPGIPHALLEHRTDPEKITSQTELFLRSFANRTIGITGTKGKSTTSSLVKHIIASQRDHVLLVGNIGIPPFDHINQIKSDSIIVYELSSHQLENIRVSPFIAVILNVYEEHLDHYKNYQRYQSAKMNITRFQSENDWLILNSDNEVLREHFLSLKLNRRYFVFSHTEVQGNNNSYIKSPGFVRCKYKGKISEFDFSNRQYLPGDHNLMNIMAAICASKVIGIADDVIHKAVLEFKGLPHRMEYIGKFRDIFFYNDSISTIPQATILAVKSLGNVNTLILGGKDRGIDYQPLVEFLPGSNVKNIIFVGEAGRRIYRSLEKEKNANQQFFMISNFQEIRSIILKNTKPGTICLLSPAAASYDMFRNFEERGEVFKKIAETL
jgi:UDP-N-acetylmuramoylalanine--D-glutamate ligase